MNLDERVKTGAAVLINTNGEPFCDHLNGSGVVSYGAKMLSQHSATLVRINGEPLSRVIPMRWLTVVNV